MMDRKFILALALAGLILIFSADKGTAVLTEPTAANPILVVIADKIDSKEFLESELPGIRQLLSEGARGLMSVRSGAGYTNSNSAYLTLGTGSRGVALGKFSGAYGQDQTVEEFSTVNFWNWTTGEIGKLAASNLIVPEIGLMQNQAEIEDRKVIPGLLGTIFRNNGWRTILIGNTDSLESTDRPGGLMLMDRKGVVDQGDIAVAVNKIDRKFPYLYRFDTVRAVNSLKLDLTGKTLAVVEFGDFARLDAFREQILPDQYLRLKALTWRRLSNFLAMVLQTWPARKMNLVLISPSLSKESWTNKNWLEPVVIRGDGYSSGVLTSGTTNWEGLVANIDLLPTLIKLARLNQLEGFSGRVFECRPTGTSLKSLRKLNQKLNIALLRQRSVIDWYLGIITFGWIWFFLWVFLKRTKWGVNGLTFLAVAPLGIILEPIFSEKIWGLTLFLSLTATLGLIFGLIKHHKLRFFYIAFFLWLILVIDQLAGWSLIRFAALGYNPATGSRYYGMGNEFMGVFLAATMILAYLISILFRKRWLVLTIWGVAIFILGWPRCGINFGGTLAALLGSGYFLIKFFKVKLNYKKIIIILGAGLILVTIFGLGDAFRAPEEQTHIGRFFSLLLNRHLDQVGMILLRKLTMNFHLIVVSPWTRIILAAFLGAIILFIKRDGFTGKVDPLIWNGIMVTGTAAFFLNDSGVVAFGTCLAFGFTYLLAEFGGGNEPVNFG